MENLKEIKTELEKLSKEFGTHEDYTIIEQAYHGCRINGDYVWEAKAVKIEGDEVTQANIVWDFEEFVKENGEDVDDAGSYPWENVTDIEIESERSLSLDFDNFEEIFNF